MAVFKVGQVWERDGKRRRLCALAVDSSMGKRVRVEACESDALREVYWKRDKPNGAERYCWCSTWLDWSDKATLVADVS